VRVNTDVRGSGMSGGALCLLCMREQKDVADVIAWIVQQPWSNGHVALYGYSYSAITALCVIAAGSWCHCTPAPGTASACESAASLAVGVGSRCDGATRSPVAERRMFHIA
jgi:putative CocE/NonD family hydrolase